MFLQRWRYTRGEKGGSRVQRTAVVKQELEVSSWELEQPCSPRAWAKDTQTCRVTNDRRGGGSSLDPSDLTVQPPPEGYRHPLSHWHLSRAVLLLFLQSWRHKGLSEGSSEGVQCREECRFVPSVHRGQTQPRHSPCASPTTDRACLGHREVLATSTRTSGRCFPGRKEKKAGEDRALEGEVSRAAAAGGAGSL